MSGLSLAIAISSANRSPYGTAQDGSLSASNLIADGRTDTGTDGCIKGFIGGIKCGRDEK